MKKFLSTSIFLLLIACQNTTEEEMKITEESLYRPLLHFTPQKNWMNDPNGMFYFNEKYHFFFNTILEQVFGGQCIGACRE